ncbi:hypothetical protein D3C86_1723750 [compost metagenome]
MTLPTPCRRATGSAATNSSTSPGVITHRPSGLCQSLAILARNLFGATPADTVMSSSVRTRWRMSSAMRVALPAKCAESDTSR